MCYNQWRINKIKMYNNSIQLQIENKMLKSNWIHIKIQSVKNVNVYFVIQNQTCKISSIIGN